MPPRSFRDPAPVRRPFWPRWWLALACFAFVPACAELPKNVERPVSHALAAPDSTPLATLVRARQQAAAASPGSSGFMLLNGPQTAYGARLALVDAAQKTLDLQYYAIHADASTGRLLRGVREAAARGVRVRILLDDFHSTGRNALVMRLAFEKNIEMRMFNPLAGARGSTLGRLFNALDDAGDLQQRMHNKLFIADNAMGVAGGRNLGDAYFGNGEDANFVDLDVLAVGPVVRDLSRSFDDYWNNELAYPVQSLVTREELDKIRDKARRENAQANTAAAQATGDGPKPPDGETRPAQAGPTPQQRRRAWDEQAMDLRQAPFVWAPAVVLVDQPTKISSASDSGAARADAVAARRGNSARADGGAGATGGASAAVPVAATLKPGASRTPVSATTASTKAGAPTPPTGKPAADSPPATAQKLPGAVATAQAEDNVVDGLLTLFGRARSDLTIVSPYFVPGDDMKRALADARARGVRVRVLTNSLASNDAAAAHAGYARHRKELLAMGIELYEMRSERPVPGAALGSSSGGSVGGSSRSMLHSKVLTLDNQLVVIGSMNLDLRSQLQNTEIALLILSEPLARQTLDRIEAGFRRDAWQVVLDGDSLRWKAPEGSDLKDAHTEPDTSLGQRLLIRVFGPLAPDRLL